MSTAEADRLSWVDTLRGIAVLCVFALHSMLDAQRYGERIGATISGLVTYANLTFGWIDLGKIGVGVFFIVSGFLIPVTLDKPYPAVIPRFLVNRMFRLYPAYWISIALTLLLVSTPLTALQALVNTTMLQRFFGVPDLNGVYWTLQIEIVFYALCIALKTIGRLSDRSTLVTLLLGFGVIAIAMAGLRFTTSLKLPVALALALQLMFFGYLYRLWLVDRSVSGHQIAILLMIVALTLACACPLAYSHDYGMGERWQRYLASYYTAIAVFGFVSLTRTTSRVLSFVGRISYSFYLLHTLVLALVIGAIERGLLSLSSLGDLAWYLALSLACACAASWTCYRLVELPGIGVGRRLASMVSAGHANDARTP